MPRTRKAITISLDPDTLARIDAAAPNGNRSAAVKAFVHATPTEPQVNTPTAPSAGDRWYQVSEPGQAVIERMAQDSGRDADEVVKMALRHAFLYSTRWLTQL
jgi:hypothetical protein